MRLPYPLAAAAACAPLALLGAAALGGTASASAAQGTATDTATRYAAVTAGIPRGYRMAAVCTNGDVTMASGPKARVRPHCRTMTLHLVDRSGGYAAPVVVGTLARGRWAVTGVRAGTALGTLRTRRGVARPTRQVAAASTVTSLRARARAGNPIGARNLGLVTSRPSGRIGPGQDYDKDGIPGVFDVDYNGNRTLDNVDPPPSSPGSGAREMQAPSPPSSSGSSSSLRLFSNYKLDMGQSLNANQGGLTQALIDSTMQANQTLAIPVAAAGALLDCTGLNYCTFGGSGSAGGAAWPTAPGPALVTAGPTGDFQLQTGATSSQIGSGDVLTEILPDGTRVTGMLNFVFGTNPALTSYSVNGAAASSVTYPATAGTVSNPITVPASGNVSVTMTYWRPQRAPIPAAGETGWMDIGLLNYSADLPNAPGGGAGPGRCAASTYTTSDPNLTASGDGLDDGQGDRAADPANTLTFTVDLTGCLGTTAWASGQTLQVDIQARSDYGDNTAQKVMFRRA